MRDVVFFPLLVVLVVVGAYFMVSLMIFLTPVLIHLEHVSQVWWMRRLGTP